MKRHYHLTRRHFSRELHLGGDDRKENSKSDGIIMQVGEDDAMNTTDVATKRLKL
jgi:hypothetical protein